MRIGVALLAIVGGVLSASPVGALTTTYVYDGFLISGHCLEGDPEFIARFPELCVDGEPPLLTITFEHDQPIWDNDASGCDPESGDIDPRCDLSIFTNIVDISFSPTADLDPSEVLGTFHYDYLGRPPCSECEGPAPPFITLLAEDAETGLRIEVSGYSEVDLRLLLKFADGRSYEDCCSWTRLATVSEPATGALVVVGLLGLASLRRRIAS